MQMKAPVQSHSLAAIIAVLALGMCAIFVLPYYVPMPMEYSVSYIFGYNNRAAISLLLLFGLGFALWTRGLGLQLPDCSQPRHALFAVTRNFAVAASVLICLAIWLCSLPLFPFFEAQYFLDRYAMWATGARIYRDFTFDYGPLMFYIPVWIARALHLSIASGHYIAWTLEWAVGTLLLYKVVNAVADSERRGRTVFLMVWGIFLTGILDSGPNYTPFRYASTLALATTVHGFYTRRVSVLKIFGLATAGAAALLFFSPEQGIAFTIATVLFFLICVRPFESRTMAGVAGFIAAMAIILWLGLRVGALNNIRTVGGGAQNIPLFFSFQTLVVILMLITAACVLIAAFLGRASNHLLVYLICLSVCCLPAALSRADIGHVLINSLGALIAALVVLSQYRALWRWTWPIFSFMILGAGVQHLHGVPDDLRAQVRTVAFGTQVHSPAVEKLYTRFIKLTHHGAAASERVEQLRSSEAAIRQVRPDAPELPPRQNLLAPMGVPRRISPFDGDPQIITGVYPAFPNIITPSIVEERLSELRDHPTWPLLLPLDPKCIVDPNGLREAIARIFRVRYMPTAKHGMHVSEPFCEYVRAKYTLGPFKSPVPGYEIWSPKPQPAEPQSDLYR
jgi:hypothetical protein